MDNVLGLFKAFSGAGAFSRRSGGSSTQASSAPTTTPPATTPQPSTPAAAPSPAGGDSGGPGSKPRGGKYIRRWWEGDHWEYEYSEDAGKHSGLAGMHSNDHTMPIHESSDPELHQRASSGDKKAAEELFAASEAQHKTTPIPKSNAVPFHLPGSNEEFIMYTKADKKAPLGLSYIVESKNDPKKKLIGGASSIEGVVKAMKVAAVSHEVKDNQGRVIALVVPTGKYDPKTNSIKAGSARGKYAFAIKPTKDTPPELLESKLFQGGTGDKKWVNKAPSVKVMLDRVKSTQALISRGQNNVPASQLIQANSASDILNNGMLPVEQDFGNKERLGISRSVRNIYDSPEALQAMTQKLFAENQQSINEKLDELSKKNPNLIAEYDPNDPLDTAIIRDALTFVALRYDPTVKGIPVSEAINRNIHATAFRNAQQEIGGIEGPAAEASTTMDIEALLDRGDEDEDELAEHQDMVNAAKSALFEKIMNFANSRPDDPNVQQVAQALSQEVNNTPLGYGNWSNSTNSKIQ